MRKWLTGFVLGLALAGGLALPVVSQVSYPVALWPVAGADNAVRTVRERLFAARTYYVRTDGHDTNCDGKTNASDASTSTTACAFLTGQKGADACFLTLDLGGYDCTVDLEDGTFTGRIAITSPQVGAGTITIQGNSSTPTNVVINWTGTSTNGAIDVRNHASVVVKDMRIQTTTGGSGLWAENGGLIYFSGIDFGATVQYHMAALWLGSIRALGNYTISGAAQYSVVASGLGVVRLRSVACTLTGTLAFTAFAIATAGAHILADGFTHSGGTITGLRHSSINNAVIGTNGGSAASHFPGNATGTTDGFGVFY